MLKLLDPIFASKNTAVCLIGSAGKFEGNKAVAKISANENEKSGPGLPGCFDDISDFKNFFE
jgi:hypothetical protein